MNAVEQLLRSRQLRRAWIRPRPPASWSLGELSGRLVELSGAGVLTAAATLLREAQEEGEPAAWVTGGATFYPPDLDRRGIDLEALVVIRVPGIAKILGAAEGLLRSGAFSLLVLDLARTAQLPLPAQTRLLGLAQKGDCTLLCLTVKGEEELSLGSLISLQARARRRQSRDGSFVWEVHVVKDKRRGPGWIHREEGFRGPPGLR